MYKKLFASTLAITLTFGGTALALSEKTDLTLVKNISASAEDNGEVDTPAEDDPAEEHEHIFGKWTQTVKPTCTKAGKEQRICDECGETETRSVAKLGHSYKTKVVKPTYFERGYTLNTCTRCGNSYKSDFTAKLTLGKVLGINTSSEEHSVKLSWKKVKDATGYVVYRYDYSKNKWGKVGMTTKTTFTNQKLKSGKIYKYAVKAYKKSGSKYASGTQSETVTAVTKPGKTSVKTYSGAKKASVTWKKVSGASGYEVYYSSSPKTGYKLLKKTSGNYASKSGLTEGKTYYFKVKAYKIVSGKKYYGEASAAKSALPYKPVKVLKAATIFSKPAFSGKYMGSVKNGSTVKFLSKNGNWYKVSVNGKFGYVYNKAFGVQSNVTGLITKDNLATKADDILFDIGRTPKAILNYVASNVLYQSRPRLSNRDDMVIIAMNFRSGACYYYSAFCDYLLERAGYVHSMVGGNSGSGEHFWAMYQTSTGWKYMDACYFRNFYPHIFCDWTASELIARRGFIWNKAAYPEF